MNFRAYDCWHPQVTELLKKKKKKKTSQKVKFLKDAFKKEWDFQFWQLRHTRCTE